MVCVTITIYAQNGSDQNIDFQIVAQDNNGNTYSYDNYRNMTYGFTAAVQN